MSVDTFDLAIIGAGRYIHSCSMLNDSPILGIHGLAVLKTYLDVHPEASVIMLDKDVSIGGVWAKDRLYPGLRTNNHFRTYVYMSQYHHYQN